jgi:hypothetical protein
LTRLEADESGLRVVFHKALSRSEWNGDVLSNAAEVA